MKQQELQGQDLTIKVDLKMSEANMIIEALSHRKFAFEALINTIVDQGNKQLPKPARAGNFRTDDDDKPDADFPVGLSEEVDDAILSLFSEEWHKDRSKFQFDTTKPGHFIAIAQVDEPTAKKLIASVEKFVDGLNLNCVVNCETEGTVAFVFSWKPGAFPAGSEALHVVTDEPTEETAD